MISPRCIIIAGQLENFETIYKPLANVWKIYDNSSATIQLVAEQK